MLTAAERSRLAVVLVGARNPQNIGAAARALHDFGFNDLRIVNDFAAPFEAAQLEAVKSAVSAQDIMRNARRFDALAPAIADCTLVAGTTAIGVRELRLPVIPIQQAAQQILSNLHNPGAPHLASEMGEAVEQTPTHNLEPKVALLFGSEKTGLTNEQLSHCSLLTTIPMFSPASEAAQTGALVPDSPTQISADADLHRTAVPQRHLSMNLGQSVAVCLYELTRSGFEGSIELPQLHEAPSTSADRERLTELLLEVMQSTGYTRRYPHNATASLVRQLTQQLGTTHLEAMTWMGILRQVLRQENPRPPASGL